MKKFGAMIILMMASLSAYAGSSPKNDQEPNGIVTPDIATGMWRTSRFVNDTTNMNILVCPLKYEYIYRDDTCRDKNNKNAWVLIENSLPQGKNYVGFKSISQGSSHAIEIYWKNAKQ
jgi:hypothetical protein